MLEELRLEILGEYRQQLKELVRQKVQTELNRFFGIALEEDCTADDELIRGINGPELTVMANAPDKT